MFKEGQEGQLEKEVRYAEGVRRELREFFVSQDLVLASDCLVPRGGLANTEVLLDERCLPPVKEFQMGIRHVLEVATRSALAQAGIEVWVDWDRLSADVWEGIERGESVPLPITLLNFGATDIQLSKGEGVFRFFYDTGRLEGKRLAETLNSEEVKLSGRYGFDWWAETGTGQRLDQNDLEKASLICLSFDPRKRLLIPPSSQPMCLPPRSRIDEVLRPVPQDIAVPFYVAETTSRISMGKNVYGVILTGVDDVTNQHHLQSPLVDSGYGETSGGSPVRVEVFDPVGLSPQKPYVYLNVIPRTAE